jgi:ATP/maltotriose-dependent transcriptional regulator MalT
MAGDAEAAESALRADYESLTAIDERYFLPNIAALLTKTVYDLGRIDEAEQLLRTALELASPEDVEALAVLRSVEARLLASRGQTDEARRLVDEVAESIRDTDAPVFRADTLMDLSEVLRDSPAERAAMLEEARAFYETKRHLIGVARAEAELAEPAAVN